MKLDRNVPPGKSKYALVCLRKVEGNPQTPQELAAAILKNPECVDFCISGDEREFFVIRLKDVAAPKALEAYAREIYDYDSEFSQDVYELFIKSFHMSKKIPD